MNLDMDRLLSKRGGRFLCGVYSLLFVALGACSTASNIQIAPPTVPHLQVPVVESLKPEPVFVEVAAVGDIMLGTDFPEDRLPPEQGRQLFAATETILSAADITVGNLEGVFLTGGEPRKQCADKNACYLFRMPPALADNLVQAGFDVLSLANNHARDFGEEGRDYTMRVLDSAGIGHSGRHGDIASWQVKNRRIVFIAFAPFIGAHDMLDISLAQKIVAEQAAVHDIVIISMHGGAEGEEMLHVPGKEEYFHGENRGDVKAFARAVIDAGADLVIGHGPHVPRALELYQDRLIAYSLGNFCTYWGINVRGPNGLAPILKVTLDGQGRFIKGHIDSYRQRRPLGPVLDKEGEAARLVSQLTHADFPSTPLLVGANGEIRPGAELSPFGLAIQP